MKDLTQPDAGIEVPNVTTRTNEAPLAPAHGSAFRDELRALIDWHSSQIGPEAAAYWLSTMAHSALAHLVWMPIRTRQAYEHLGEVCDLLPMPNDKLSGSSSLK